MSPYNQTTGRQSALYGDFAVHVLDAIPAMVAYWDSTLRCRFANHAYKDWFGRASSAVVGMSMRELLGEDLFVANERYISEALRGYGQQFLRSLVTARGECRQTLATYVPDLDEDRNVLGFAVLVVDVTPLVQGLAEVPYTPASRTG